MAGHLLALAKARDIATRRLVNPSVPDRLRARFNLDRQHELRRQVGDAVADRLPELALLDTTNMLADYGRNHATMWNEGLLGQLERGSRALLADPKSTPDDTVRAARHVYEVAACSAELSRYDNAPLTRPMT